MSRKCMRVALRDGGHNPNRTSLYSGIDGSVIRTGRQRQVRNKSHAGELNERTRRDRWRSKLRRRRSHRGSSIKRECDRCRSRLRYEVAGSALSSADSIFMSERSLKNRARQLSNSMTSGSLPLRRSFDRSKHDANTHSGSSGSGMLPSIISASCLMRSWAAGWLSDGSHKPFSVDSKPRRDQ